MVQKNNPQNEVPGWLRNLCGVAVILMANQLRAPLSGIWGKICLSDISFLIAFVCVVIHIFRAKDRLAFPWLLLLPAAIFPIANCLSGSGGSGAFEAVKWEMYLVCAPVFFTFLRKHLDDTLLFAVTLGLVANIAVAGLQYTLFGSYVVHAPKDVVELPWGIGQTLTGLFRSRITYSLYVGITSCWLAPQFFARTCRRGYWVQLPIALFLAVALLSIPYGPILVIASLILLVYGLCMPWRMTVRILSIFVFLGIFAAMPKCREQCYSWRDSITIFKGYHYREDAKVLFNRIAPPFSDSAYSGAHELKSCHYDLLAAFRIAWQHPWYGVGSSRYQDEIHSGYCLDESKAQYPLPDPRLNDIETDSQSAWGILAATTGVVSVCVFGFVLLVLLAWHARRITWLDDEVSMDEASLHIGSVLAGALILVCMFLTDPLTRGIGWFAMLVFTGAVWKKEESKRQLGRVALSVIGGVIVLLVAAIPVSTRLWGKGNTLTIEKKVPTGETAAVVAPAEPKSAPEGTAVSADAGNTNSANREVPKVTPEKTSESSIQTKVAPDSSELYLVMNANDAGMVTAPMKMAAPEGAFANGVLVIPDQAGVPPEGKAPALEYGGCVFQFELKRETTAYLWLNVEWDGSCGNTLEVKMDDSLETHTVGNDSIYHEWHWKRSPKTYKLSAGVHRLWVLNREDGIKLGQILLVNDKEIVPEGIEEGDN